MKNLQSKEMPLRCSALYFQPGQPRKDNSTIKVFADTRKLKSIRQLVMPEGELPVINYLHELNSAQGIQRRLSVRRDMEASKVGVSLYDVGIKKKHRRKHSHQDTSLETMNEARKEMRFSFYNTIEKSNYFSEKYRHEDNICNRAQNNYQNMLNRTLLTKNLLETLRATRRLFL